MDRYYYLLVNMSDDWVTKTIWIVTWIATKTTWAWDVVPQALENERGHYRNRQMPITDRDQHLRMFQGMGVLDADADADADAYSYLVVVAESNVVSL